MTAAPPHAAGPRGFGARLAGDAVVYGLGGMVNQAVAVLLVPIYARQLGPAGVGITGVLNSTISLALVIVGVALPQAFFRWYLHESRDAADRRRVLATTLALRIVISGLGFALILLAAIPLTWLLYAGDHVLVFALAAPIVLFDSFNAIPLSFLRAERRPRTYVLVAITRAVLGTVLILGFVVVANIGVVGVALGAAIAAGLSAVIGGAVLVRAGLLRLGLDGSLARRLLAFATPLIPAGIAGWALNLADRPILQAMTGDAELVGIYTMGYTAGLVINALVIQPFTLAWGAAFWEIARSDSAPATFARTLTWFLAIAAGIALALSALGGDVLDLLVGPAFAASRFIIPFSAFAFVLVGAYAIAASGLHIVGRSRRLAAAIGVAAVLTLILNVVLIPPLGLFGPALATIVGYFTMLATTGFLGQRHYPVPWQLGRAGIILVVAALLTLAALFGPDHLVWRIGCAAAYAPILLGLGVVRPAQGRALLAVIRGR